MKRTAPFVICAAMVAAACSHGPATPTTARVAPVFGTVQMRHGTHWTDLSGPADLAVGDLVRSVGNAYGRIELVNGGWFEIGPATTLRLAAPNRSELTRGMALANGHGLAVGAGDAKIQAPEG